MTILIAYLLGFCSAVIVYLVREAKALDELDEPPYTQGKTQFVEPITFKQKFENAKTVDDLLDE